MATILPLAGIPAIRSTAIFHGVIYCGDKRCKLDKDGAKEPDQDGRNIEHCRKQKIL
jgi:hypothetical protein